MTLIGGGSSSERNRLDFESKLSNDPEISVVDFYQRYWVNHGSNQKCFKASVPKPYLLDATIFFPENDRWNVYELLELVNHAIPSSLLGVRVIRGVNDIISEENARELVTALNEDAKKRTDIDKNLCTFDNVENSASCVHLDRAEYLLDTTSTYLLNIEEELNLV